MAKTLSDLSSSDITDVQHPALVEGVEEVGLSEDVISRAAAGHELAQRMAGEQEDSEGSGSESGTEEHADDSTVHVLDIPQETVTVSQKIASRPKAVAASISGGTQVLTRYV